MVSRALIAETAEDEGVAAARAEKGAAALALQDRR